MTSSLAIGLAILVYSILLNIPAINYHPMNPLPSIASYPSNIADRFTKPLSFSRHRFTTTTLIGDEPPTPTTSVATAIVDSSATVNSSATVDSSATVVASTAASVSNSVPSLHPNPASTLPIVLDTGASLARPLDFSLEIAPASYGLFRSSTLVISKALATKALASTPVDPYTLITGEDAIDLSCPDIDSDYIDSDSGSSFTKVTFDIRDFGTATLTFIYSKSSSELLHIFVDPTQVDWLHWIPLPRLTPTESYFHICGRDYLQAFALFHLIPIWIALVSALLRSE